jgi:hypothetical protein
LQAKFFGRRDKSIVSSSAGVGLAFSVAAQGKDNPVNGRDESLPASVQQTINQKAAGGEIVQIKREDDSTARGTMKSRQNEWERVGLRGGSEREVREEARRSKIMGNH